MMSAINRKSTLRAALLARWRSIRDATAARKRVGGGELRRELEQRGIVVRSPSNRGLAEEAPLAYKDVELVVDVVRRAGLADPVAQLRPVGVVKG